MNYTELSLKELRKISLIEAKKIAEEYPTDLIVYVARAGLLIAFYMNEFFGVDLLGIGAQRKGNSLKSKLGPLVRYFPRFVRDLLITIELKTKVHKRDVRRNIAFHKSIERLEIDKYKKILIVDDSVDTGNSMRLVYEAVKEKFPNTDVKTYSLNVWEDSKQVFKIDYCSYENTVIRAPMSKDSKEYDEFCRLYEEISENGYI